MLRLGDMRGGGRWRAQLHDLLGLRAVVRPCAHLPPAEAEHAAQQVSGLPSLLLHRDPPPPPTSPPPLHAMEGFSGLHLLNCNWSHAFLRGAAVLVLLGWV